MTPAERAEALIDRVRAAMRSAGPGAPRIDAADAVPPVAWPVAWLVEAIEAAVAAERARCADAVRAYRGAPSRTGILRAVLEPPGTAEDLDAYDPELARQLRTAEAFLAEAKARLVEERRRAKGDWRGASPALMFVRLAEEVGRLAAVLREPPFEVPPERQEAAQREAVKRRAANVANFAMIVADLAGAWE